jgi:hypothetical protein
MFSLWCGAVADQPLRQGRAARGTTRPPKGVRQAQPPICHWLHEGSKCALPCDWRVACGHVDFCSGGTAAIRAAYAAAIAKFKATSAPRQGPQYRHHLIAGTATLASVAAYAVTPKPALSLAASVGSRVGSGVMVGAEMLGYAGLLWLRSAGINAVWGSLPEESRSPWELAVQQQGAERAEPSGPVPLRRPLPLSAPCC